MIKSVDASSTNWEIFDTVRERDNSTTFKKGLRPAVNSAEHDDGFIIDWVSNGVKLRTSGGNVNTSGHSYIYAAFAEYPNGGSGVTPATAF